MLLAYPRHWTAVTAGIRAIAEGCIGVLDNAEDTREACRGIGYRTPAMRRTALRPVEVIIVEAVESVGCSIG